MTGFHVTGPIAHYISFPGDNSTAYLLGTSVVTPRIRIDRAYLPVMMEQGGYALPFDLSYQGKEAKILTKLNYFETQTAYLLGCSPRYGRSKLALGRGLDSYLDNGALVLGNQGYFCLYLVFTFADTPNAPRVPVAAPPIANNQDVNNAAIGIAGGLVSAPPVINVGKMPQSSQNQPLCYRFPACVVEFEEITGGSGEEEFNLLIHAQRIYYSRKKFASSLKNSPLAGGFLLYDHRLPPQPVQPAITSTLTPGAVNNALRGR